MTNKFLLNLLGFNPDLTSRQPRVDSLSLVSRQSDLLTYLGRIAAILLLVLTIGSGNVWGADVTIAASGVSGWNSTRGSQSGTASGFTFTTTDGVYNTQLRTYANATFSISSSVGNITNIVFTYSQGGFSNPSVGTISSGTWTGNTSSLSFKETAQVRITQMVITYTAAAGPAITVSATSLTEVGYSTADFTQQVKSFTVSGSSLKANVTVTAPTDFEVCKTSGGTYTSSVSFEKGSGTLSSSTVYVRLKSGKAAGNYSGDVSCTSTNATTKTVGLSGSVPYTITWSANGSTFTTTYVAVGGTLTLPGSTPDPATYSCTGKYFYGWYGLGSSYSHASTAPTIAATGNAVSADKTYYAVFADRSGSGEVTWDKVTSTPSDWSGDYVIVESSSSKAMISDFYSGSSGEFKSASVTINAAGTQITSTPTDKMIWTFAKNGNNAQYSLKNKSTSTYAQITGTSSTNAALNASAQWFTIESTATSGVWDVASVANSARCFAWYATNSSFRTYAKSTNNTGRLFKKSGDGYTWSNYATTCCTPLGTINGSFS